VETTVQVFWVPKEGYSPDEYEDAFSCSPEKGIFAIADGATESSFADLWAQCLVQRFTATPPAGEQPDTATLQQWLSPMQKEWHASIAWDRLPWYAEEKARTGAFATLLGIRFYPARPVEKPSFFKRLFGGGNNGSVHPKWHAITVGDSNLFHIRNNTLVRTWPILKAADFDSRPCLLSSNPNRNQPVWEQVQHLTGDYQENDLFILATDAMAKWFLQRHEAGSKPWQELLAVKSEADYAQFVTKLRKDFGMRNDDTTVILFKWTASKQA
jgi:hypothetical protein